MGVRHAEQEQIERLEAKTLDAQLRQILVTGLACSPFEAEAVQGVYAPFFRCPDDAAAQPSQVISRASGNTANLFRRTSTSKSKDPEERVRLSDFKEKKAVALVFGSYT